MTFDMEGIVRQSDSIANLAAALVRVQGRMAPVHKDRTNPGYRSRYATLDAITEAARPILAEEGVAVVQGGAEPVLNDAGVSAIVLETRLIHASGEWLESALTIPLSKIDAQGVGSALTYARRYALSAAIGVTTDEDDDGNAASGPAKKKAPERPEPKPSIIAPTTVAAAKKFLMQFGHSRGTPLGDIPKEKLEKALAWATEQNKYAEFQAAAHLILSDEPGAFTDPLPPEKPDTLPFK